MSTCVYVNCMNPVSGRLMVCDPHMASRRKECEQLRSRANYKPQNPDCTLQSHIWVATCGCREKPFTHIWVATCEKCHFCNEVHPMVAAVPA